MLIKCLVFLREKKNECWKWGQWYPGHIAKTEKELKEQLKLMDVVIEVRDARIPLSTTHPQVRLTTYKPML